MTKLPRCPWTGFFPRCPDRVLKILTLDRTAKSPGARNGAPYFGINNVRHSFFKWGHKQKLLTCVQSQIMLLMSEAWKFSFLVGIQKGLKKQGKYSDYQGLSPISRPEIYLSNLENRTAQENCKENGNMIRQLLVIFWNSMHNSTELEPINKSRNLKIYTTI